MVNGGPGLEELKTVFSPSIGMVTDSRLESTKTIDFQTM